MNRPAQPVRPTSSPGTAGPAPFAADTGAAAAADNAYQRKRAEAVTLGAAAILLADLISGGAQQVSDEQAAENAFDLAEAFATAAEKRLGGKLPL